MRWGHYVPVINVNRVKKDDHRRVEHIYAFPTLTRRQVAIIYAALSATIGKPFYVDGEIVRSEEWSNLIMALQRGVK